MEISLIYLVNGETSSLVVLAASDSRLSQISILCGASDFLHQARASCRGEFIRRQQVRKILKP
jgi:hypothetical protein